MPHTPRAPKIPTQDDIKKLIAATKDGEEQDLFLVTLHSLGRISEILRLRWADVHWEDNKISLWTRKRKGGALEEDIIPMNAVMKKTLELRFSTREQDEWVFYNRRTKTQYHHRPKYMPALCKEAGVRQYGWHDLRRFLSGWLRQNKEVTVPEISALLRHKDIRTTELYLKGISIGLREALRGAEKFRPVDTNVLPHDLPPDEKGATQ